MRGITSDDGAAFNKARVSVFQDGVSISKSRGSYAELFDIKRVEKEHIRDAGNTGNNFGLPTFVAGEPRFYGLVPQSGSAGHGSFRKSAVLSRLHDEQHVYALSR